MARSDPPSLVLVPVDGGDPSLAAAEYAAAVAAEYDAAVHALYVVDADLARALEDGAIDDATLATEVETFLDAVADVVAEVGVDCSTSMAAGFSTSRLSVHPGSVVLDTADELDADFLVVPRHRTGADGGDDPPEKVLAKAAEHVLLYATQPVLSV
jgi:nucleotide-binding universal stress UspA family protein